MYMYIKKFQPKKIQFYRLCLATVCLFFFHTGFAFDLDKRVEIL